MTDHAPGTTTRQDPPEDSPRVALPGTGPASPDAPPLAPSPAAIGRDPFSEGGAVCTQAQLRRFIKSRPYVPLHELRRRFGLNGADDDVAPVDLEDRRVFVGLPAREAGLLGELMRHGEVGYELLLDPTSPIVIGVFPMRPIQRP
jgi:hypothetical protein